jgi:dATP/dGTP diphosphohydrolase
MVDKCKHCRGELSANDVTYHNGSCESCDTGAGQKHDEGKPRYSLMPPEVLAEVVEVLTFGAAKYGDHNWKTIDNLQGRYYDALQRHVEDYRQGEKVDEDSAKHSLAHAICCLVFMMADDMEASQS